MIGNMGINIKSLRTTIILLLIQDTVSLRDVSIRIPEAAQRGSRIEMKCFYQLEVNEILYSVKWYRGDREFCRYSPRDVPPLKVFDIPGITVDRDASDAERITIDPVTKVAHGRYMCEVSADAPSFQTHQVDAYMYVVDLPQSGPVMHGMKRWYKPGMKLKVECISRKSVPAANISFFVNNEPAQSEHVWHRIEGDGMSPLGQLWTSYSTIQFMLQKQHFPRGKIKIRCTALIYNIYTKSLEKSGEQERVRPTAGAAVWQPREANIYSVHRIAADNFTSDVAPAAAKKHTSKISLFCILLLLPTVLR